MLIKWIRLFPLLCLLFASIFTVSAQEEDSFFTPQGEEPIIARGDNTENDWDWRYTDPGAVTFYDGQFHMLRNGFNDWPASVQMGYLVSDDGIVWEEPQDEPVLFTDDIPFAEIAALASSLHVENDGTWVLYFYTWNTFTSRSPESTIGRATADNPLGPWTVDPEPVLTFDESLGEIAVFAPSVIVNEDEYTMFYAAYDEEGAMSIRRATSENGIVWEKNADPVLTASEEWESTSVHQPRVFEYEGNLWMLYRAIGSGSTAMRLGLASSMDGIHWEKYRNNPVFQPRDVPDMYQFWFHAATVAEDTLYLYVEATASGTTDIFALTTSLSDVVAETSS